MWVYVPSLAFFAATVGKKTVLHSTNKLNFILQVHLKVVVTYDGLKQYKHAAVFL